MPDKLHNCSEFVPDHPKNKILTYINHGASIDAAGRYTDYMFLSLCQGCAQGITLKTKKCHRVSNAYGSTCEICGITQSQLNQFYRQDNTNA